MAPSLRLLAGLLSLFSTLEYVAPLPYYCTPNVIAPVVLKDDSRQFISFPDTSANKTIGLCTWNITLSSSPPGTIGTALADDFQASVRGVTPEAPLRFVIGNGTYNFEWSDNSTDRVSFSDYMLLTYNASKATAETAFSILLVTQSIEFPYGPSETLTGTSRFIDFKTQKYFPTTYVVNSTAARIVAVHSTIEPSDGDCSTFVFPGRKLIGSNGLNFCAYYSKSRVAQTSTVSVAIPNKDASFDTKSLLYLEEYKESEDADREVAGSAGVYKLDDKNFTILSLHRKLGVEISELKGAVKIYKGNSKNDSEVTLLYTLDEGHQEYTKSYLHGPAFMFDVTDAAITMNITDTQISQNQTINNGTKGFIMASASSDVDPPYMPVETYTITSEAVPFNFSFTTGLSAGGRLKVKADGYRKILTASGNGSGKSKGNTLTVTFWPAKASNDFFFLAYNNA